MYMFIRTKYTCVYVYMCVQKNCKIYVCVFVYIQMLHQSKVYIHVCI